MKFVTSRDVVFDEVSSSYAALKLFVQDVVLHGDQGNLLLFPEENVQTLEQ